MRGGVIILLVGLTAFGACWAGNAAPAIDRATTRSDPVLPAMLIAAADSPVAVPDPVKPRASEPQAASDAKLKAILADTAAVAIAVAAIIAASRSDYHATVGPCACPDDKMRDGVKRCGKLSAHYRRNGHAPMCHPGDVPEEKILEFLKRQASSPSQSK